MENVVSMAHYTPHNANNANTVHTKDAALKRAVAEAVRKYVSPITGLTGQPTTADYRDPNAAATLAEGILSETELHYNINNAMTDRGGVKWPIPTTIPPHVIADLLVATGDFAVMSSFDGDNARLLMRVRTGSDAGIHKAIDPDHPAPELMLMITNLCPSIATRNVKEVVARILSDIRLQQYDPQRDFDSMLVWCRNGIYNLHDSTFTAYDDPAFDARYSRCISTWKLAVDYNPAATQMPVLKTAIGDDWSWDKQLTDTFDIPGADPAVVKASIKGIEQMFHFCVRGISGGFAIWFTNASDGANGRNGKSTITEVLRQLLGAKNVLATAVEDLGERFALARLPYVAAIVSDETNSDVRAVEKAAVYKALTTGEAVMIDEKQKTAYSYSGFHGLMVQAMNDVLRFMTSGGSLWRRILVYRFERNFELLGECPEVKTDFVKRPEVLEAILYRALHMKPIDRFSPDVVAALEPNKSGVRSMSSKVWAYMEDVECLLREWAYQVNSSPYGGKPFRVPLKLLYDCYRDKVNGWSQSVGLDRPLAYNSFTSDFIGWVSEHSDSWKFFDKSKPTAIPRWMDDYRIYRTDTCPLLWNYPAADWAYDGTYTAAGQSRGAFKADRMPNIARGVLEYVGTYPDDQDTDND